MARKRIGVLTGGSGLIGGTIVNYYKTYHAETVDIRAPSSKKLSLREESDIRRYLLEVRPDFVINTAMANLGSDGQLSYEVNYKGPVNLGRATSALNIPFIHISSAAALPPGVDLKEDQALPLKPSLSNYAKSKLMTEATLKLMGQENNLDYTCIRLAIAYGAHDHKIQGFHRLLFAVADEAIPLLFTKPNTLHSYTNARKLPHFIHHILANRQEFTGQIYHFVDKNPVDLATLILTIKSYLNLDRPREIYVPFWVANYGKKVIELVLAAVRKMGIQAAIPPELMFLDNLYNPQVLSNEKLNASSFVDPMPEETIFTRLPELVIYYLSRWTHENLITTFKDILDEPSVADIFAQDPERLLELVHKQGLHPFKDMGNP
ncbi:NAD(P)-dependent oxidoreductase [Desulforhopalus sp. IMCC35007]|uniref:NAD-dependent epimerase/dehydratase family protein n=1 Tax=Desulforhopalus sp. IMCC35007 TaxID=2569543 RepID=UPI0010ADD718|nr:NAD(P)-dependent oxidoreductase [Desulforhopalus sp. IMCC35007]TKB10754.1 NAD(P)-dependent oxidoreductase [Desulforhopalus sp. IMCC35007]